MDDLERMKRRNLIHFLIGLTLSLTGMSLAIYALVTG